MTQNIDTAYEEAVASGLLPGFSLFAGDKDGNVMFPIYTLANKPKGLKTRESYAITLNKVGTPFSITQLTWTATRQCPLLQVTRQSQPERGRRPALHSLDSLCRRLDEQINDLDSRPAMRPRRNSGP
jgi:hypothetical protein